MSKLSKRDRYILKWNGPWSLEHKKKAQRQFKAGMGKGDEGHRVSCTAYVCRFRGFFPKTVEEFYRRAGFDMQHDRKAIIPQIHRPFCGVKGKR